MYAQKDSNSISTLVLYCGVFSNNFARKRKKIRFYGKRKHDFELKILKKKTLSLYKILKSYSTNDGLIMLSNVVAC